jgi:[calcium/calmodulin-dependent protein kinase] kinase
MRMYDEIREARLTFPADVSTSPALADLLRRMLAKEPAQRLSMPQIMAHPWVTRDGAAPLHCLQVNMFAPTPNFVCLDAQRVFCLV